uniref:(northern house mosquito) hypothetical protein n=1 Tax=Culex pipiens TaxID=7175 RepID=A0A8D8AP29_CULPI
MSQKMLRGNFPICYLRKEIKTFCSINRQKKTKLNGKALLIGVYGVVVCENASVHQINSACACGSGEIKLCLCPWDRKRRDTCHIRGTPYKFALKKWVGKCLATGIIRILSTTLSWHPATKEISLYQTNDQT